MSVPILEILEVLFFVILQQKNNPVVLLNVYTSENILKMHLEYDQSINICQSSDSVS